MISKIKENINLVTILLFLIPILSGGVSLWSNFFVATICIGGILYKIIKNKKIILPKGKNFIFLCIYVFSFFIVEFYAIDKGMNLMGFFKNLVIILFILLFLQYEKLDKRKIINLIPYSAIISLVFGVCIIAIPEMVNAGRFQGTFMYANSYGLFLLIGIIITLMKEKIVLKDIIVFSLLMFGIMFTNSRAIIILTFLAILITIIMNKENRKKLTCILLSAAIIFGTIYLFSNLDKRIDTEMFESSEFITRLLYYADAVEMCKDNPFGYGYLGYYYKQVEVQTGIYDTKYVHNSILQIILDVGLIPFFIISILLISVFFNKRQNKINRLILIFVLGHSLIDIDLEYMYFIYLITMMIDFETTELKRYRGRISLALSIILMIYIILFLGTISMLFGNCNGAYSVVPFYTDALQEELYTTTSEEKQLEMAKRIYPLNKNVSGICEVFSAEYQKEKDYENAWKFERKRLALNKYSIENYMYYLEFLSKAWQYNLKTGQNTEAKKYVEEILNIENMINEVIDNTNPLNQKTKHKVMLKMPEDMVEYIEKVRAVEKGI